MLLPEGAQRALYPGLTSVSSFRVILHYYPGADLDPIPDQMFGPDLSGSYSLAD